MLTVRIPGTNISRTVSVRQEPGSGLVLSASEWHTKADEFLGRVYVVSDRAWDVVNNFPDWIDVGPLSGSGNGSFAVYLYPNFGAARNGTITVRTRDGTTTRTVRIFQEAGTTLAASHNWLEAPAGACFAYIGVWANDNLNWSITSNAGWLSTSPVTSA